MSDPFDWSNDISLIDHQESLRTESADLHEAESHFRDLCNYVTNIAKLWGLYLPVLPYTASNQRLVQSLMELVRMHQKDLDYREKVQEDLAKKQFQVDMSASELKRAKAELEDYRRQLGNTENRLKAEQSRSRKELEKLQGEKNLVLQSRSKLEQKNNQLTHELKKRELECQKLKDSVRRPAEKAPLKNGIQMIGQLPTKRASDEQLVSSNLQFLKDKYQREREQLLKESEHLRAELRSYFTEVTQFVSWLRQYVSELQAQAANQLGRRVEQHPEHVMGFNHGHLTAELQEVVEDLKRLLAVELEGREISTPAAKPLQRATIANIKRQREQPQLNQNKPRQETIKPVATQQNPSFSKPRQPSHSQHNPKPKMHEAMRQPSQLSLIEHASIRDFEISEQSYPISRLANNHWDILNDD